MQHSRRYSRNYRTTTTKRK